MSASTVRGRAWKFGDDIDTDAILPSQYMRKPPEEYANHAMEPLDPSFAEEVSKGDVVVAGLNFGIGSSREQAVVALDRLGISAVVAVSFARIFRRNAVNEGLPVVACDRTVVDAISAGDELEVRPFQGTVRNLTTGETHEFDPIGDPVRSILEAGGAVEFYGSNGDGK